MAQGYTLLLAPASYAINASLYPKLSFDPIKDFSPISLVSSSPFILVVPTSVPVSSVQELIAFAKSKPGRLNYASGGTSGQLAAELFRSMAGISIVNVPCKSSAMAIPDLLGGRVSMMFSAPPAALPLVNTGRRRALGVSGLKRLIAAPEIPTISESGVAGYEVDSWSGLLAPAATPKKIISKLNAEVSNTMKLPDVRDRLPPLGVEAKTTTAEQFATYLEAEITKWAKIIRETGVRPE
ncbi:MAG: tripartite tricarboxylate transporter substrate binding protein [Betaproteobacteria bacterium]|nr:tripartite tricarboxylate transporter substrate binding protein [Betaproteobacteria bacterium]